MPLIIKFGRSVPEKYRDDVQRRMTVTATPAQEGIWRWTSPTEVHYRPKTYWKANSKISYKVALQGVPMGDGWYGRSDLTVDMKIGRSLVMTVDNKTKQMTVMQDGKTIKTIPVSLGKPKHPVVQRHHGRHREEAAHGLRHDGRAGPGRGLPHRDRLRAADHVERAVHPRRAVVGGRAGQASTSRTAASTSPMAMGKWLFGRTMMGDPITVKGTEVEAEERQRLDRLEHELGRVQEGQLPLGGRWKMARSATTGPFSSVRQKSA